MTYYETSNGFNGHLSGPSTIVWFNGTEFKKSTAPTGNITEKQKIGTITVTYYGYSLTDYLDRANKAYQMILGKANNYYWLANTVSCKNYYAVPIMRCDVGDEEKGYTNLVDFNVAPAHVMYYGSSDSSTSKCAVRAVVQLSKDLKLTGSSSSGWSIV